MSELRVFQMRVRIDQVWVEDIGWVKCVQASNQLVLKVRRDGTLIIDKLATKELRNGEKGVEAAE